jgi:hypothetical protein
MIDNGRAEWVLFPGKFSKTVKDGRGGKKGFTVDEAESSRER